MDNVYFVKKDKDNPSMPVISSKDLVKAKDAVKPYLRDDGIKISKSNMEKLKVLIEELYELSSMLPNLTKDVCNTNINFRLWVLNNWINNPKEDIDYDIDYEIE